ncbi:unnamed protein product [Caenorhabditis sp. 36 PRJEB53466]|nr:unnamed protein product [Caenorhabditis sp. 36 PRJEB53466]
MDTFSYRLRFGNSTFAGSYYNVFAPTFNANYDCQSEEPLQCSSSSGFSQSSAFAVFNMKYMLKLSTRIPSVFCYPNIRMFDMDTSLVKQYQVSGDLPIDALDLHLTEVGCIEYEPSGVTVSVGDTSINVPQTTVSIPRNSNTSALATCNCPLPPPVMTQSAFNYRFAWQFPKTNYDFGTPEFVYTEGCQSVSMVCNFPVSSILLQEKQSQRSLMFFNEDYLISGNDIRDVATRFNLHCDSASEEWKFDGESENKFKSLLGVDSIQLTELGCATITED